MENKHKSRLIAALVLSLTIASCGFSVGGGSSAPIIRTYATNAVKLITNGKDVGTDASDLTQTIYRVSSDTRLLLNFEELAQHTGSVSTSNGRIWLKVTPRDN